VLDIFEEEDLLNKNKPKQERLKNRVIERFADHKYCGEVRSIGFITAVELVKDRKTKEPFDWRERIGFQIYRKAFEKGALLRNLGDVIYFMPPYVITQAQIDELVDIAFDSVVEVLGG